MCIRDRYVTFDAGKNELGLSQILNWYGGDWNERFPSGGYFEWLEALADDPTVKQALVDGRNEKVAVKFIEYDWALNSQADPGKPRAKKKKSGGFGSGSSPDE